MSVAPLSYPTTDKLATHLVLFTDDKSNSKSAIPETTEILRLAELMLGEALETKPLRRRSQLQRNVISLLYGMTVAGTSVFGGYKTLETTETQTSTMPIIWEISATDINSYLRDIVQNDYIKERVKELFWLGKQEILADGQVTMFPNMLLDFIDHFHAEAIIAIEEAIEDTDGHFDLITDVLSVVGESEDFASHDKRRELLVKHLASGTPLIRYGAIMGLISLNDFKSIPAVNNALKTETDKMLRGFLGQLLVRLDK